MGRRVTMQTVAREAGVERSTVSRVLKGDFQPNRYRAETVKRIQAAVAKLGYRTSIPALALKTGKTMSIGLVVADISVQFFADIASHLDELCWKAGYKLVISNSREDPATELSALRAMHDHMVDGLIISPSSLSKDHLRELLQYDGEVVLFDRTGRQVSFPTVTVDNFGGAAQAVGRLLGLGHREIGAVMGRRKDPSIAERVRGYQTALRRHNVGAPPGNLVYGAVSAELAEAASEKLLTGRKRPTAMFAGEAACSIGVIRAARKLRLRIPEDLSLIGFDDFPASDVLNPPVDVLRQPAEAIASECFRILMSHLQSGRPARPEQVVLPVKLIVRGSCGPVPAERHDAAAHSRKNLRPPP